MALAAGRTVVADRRVADLAGRSGRAVVEVAVDEERTADAGAHRDEQQMTRAASGAGLQLRIPGGGRVVAEDHRTPDSLGQHRRGGNLVPSGHVRRVVDDARAGIDRPGNADRKAADVSAAGGLARALRDRIEHRGGAVVRRGVAVHRLAMGDVADRDRGADAGTAQVDADERGGHTAATESSQWLGLAIRAGVVRVPTCRPGRR